MEPTAEARLEFEKNNGFNHRDLEPFDDGYGYTNYGDFDLNSGYGASDKSVRGPRTNPRPSFICRAMLESSRICVSCHHCPTTFDAARNKRLILFRLPGSRVRHIEKGSPSLRYE